MVWLPKSSALVIGAIALLAGAQPARAQTGSNGYLFGPPQGSITLRGGYASPRAGSDLFSYTTSELSLGRSDFAALEIGADLALPAGRRWEWLLSVDASSRRADSDYRQYIGSDGLPINQQTTFTRVPILFGARYYLRAPGTAVGRLAWVPASWTPWIAVQGGALWYQFTQKGEFVDFNNGNAVFAGELDSSGWTLAGSVAAGITFNLSPWLSLVTQARYVHARTTLSSDYRGFQPIDLAGTSVTAGLTLRIP